MKLINKTKKRLDAKKADITNVKAEIRLLELKAESMNKGMKMLKREYDIMVQDHFREQFFIPKNVWVIETGYELIKAKPLMMNDEYDKWCKMVKTLGKNILKNDIVNFKKTPHGYELIFNQKTTQT